MLKKSLQALQEDVASYFEQYPDEESFIATEDGLFFKQSDRNYARDHALKSKIEMFEIKRSDLEKKGTKEKSLTPDDSWTVADLAAFLKTNQVEIPKGSKKPEMLVLASEFIKQQNPTE